MLTKSYLFPFAPIICGGIYPTPIMRLKRWNTIRNRWQTLENMTFINFIRKIVISFKKFKNQLTEFSGEETIDGILFASC